MTETKPTRRVRVLNTATGDVTWAADISIEEAKRSRWVEIPESLDGASQEKIRRLWKREDYAAQVRTKKREGVNR